MSYGCRHKRCRVSDCWADIPDDPLPCCPSCWDEKILLLLSLLMSQNVCYWEHYLKYLTLTAQCKGNSGTCFQVVDSLHRLILPPFGCGSSEGHSSWDLFEAVPRYLRPIKMANNEIAQRYSRSFSSISYSYNLFHHLWFPCRSYTATGRETAKWSYVKRLWPLKLKIIS